MYESSTPMMYLLAEAAAGITLSRVAFTSDGRRLVVEESDGEGSSAMITIRSTLKPIGAPIRPAGFYGSYISEWWTDPSIALTQTAARSSPRHPAGSSPAGSR